MHFVKVFALNVKNNLRFTRTGVIMHYIGGGCMSLSTILKSRRKELGLTLNDIAQQMNVSEATVQRWESGNIKSLRQGRVSKLAVILNVSPSTLMGWEGEPSSLAPTSRQIDASEENLLEKYRNLDGYGKEVVDLVLDAEHRRVSEQQDTVEFAARSGQRGKVRRVDNLDDLLPPADEDPSHI